MVNTELQDFVDSKLSQDISAEQRERVHFHSQEGLLLVDLFDQIGMISKQAKKQKTINDVILKDAGYRLALAFMNHKNNQRAEAALNEQAKLRSRKQEILGRCVRGESQDDASADEWASAQRYTRAYFKMFQHLEAGGAFQIVNFVRGKAMQYGRKFFDFDARTGNVYLLQSKQSGGKVALSYLDVCQYGEALPENKVL